MIIFKYLVISRQGTYKQTSIGTGLMINFMFSDKKQKYRILLVYKGMGFILVSLEAEKTQRTVILR